LEHVLDHVPIIEIEPKTIEYFDPLIGTRHVDPTSGLQYEVVQVKMNRERYIIVYRRRVSHGKISSALDRPTHSEEVVRWTEDGLDYLRQFNSNENIVNDSNDQQDFPTTRNRRERSSETTVSESFYPVAIKAFIQVRLNSKEPSKLKASGKGLAVGTRQESLPDAKMASKSVRVVKRLTGCIVTNHTSSNDHSGVSCI
jgi:hypothetical protein